MATVRSKTVSTIARKIDRARYQLHYSGSANNQEFEQEDIVRQKSYVTDIIEFVEYAQKRKPLDQPVARPTEYDLVEPSKYALVKNDAVNDMDAMWKSIAVEIGQCQSSFRSGGLMDFDKNRLYAALDDIMDFMANYIEKVTPLDYPEPMNDRALVGSSGIRNPGSSNN